MIFFGLRLHLLAATTITLTLAVPAEARPPSPFDPGGPLEPWRAPLPPQSPLRPPQPPPQPQPPPVATPPPAPEQQRWAPVDTDWDRGREPDRRAPTDDSETRHTYLTAIVNPALVAAGALSKLGVRAEFSPFGPHALFFEYSSVTVDWKDLEQEVTAREYDFGYHLFTNGDGARGFYIGPRYIFGSGETAGAVGTFHGFGGDLGYQALIANHLVINLGAGVAWLSGEAEPDAQAQAVADDAGVSAKLSSEADGPVPLVTLGLGLGF